MSIRVFADWPGKPGFNPRSSHTKNSKKWYLMPPCLTLSIIRYGSRVKCCNPGKVVPPSPTPWCSSYRKRSLRSPTLLFYIWKTGSKSEKYTHTHQKKKAQGLQKVIFLSFDLFTNVQLFGTFLHQNIKPSSVQYFCWKNKQIIETFIIAKLLFSFDIWR